MPAVSLSAASSATASTLAATAPADAIDPQAMQAAATRASALLKALANPDRLLLLCQLSQGEYCVSELAEALAIQQPTLSQQLCVLRAEQLVDTRREGKQIYYRLSSPEAAAVLRVLYTLYCPAPTESPS